SRAVEGGRLDHVARARRGHGDLVRADRVPAVAARAVEIAGDARDFAPPLAVGTPAQEIGRLGQRFVRLAGARQRLDDRYVRLDAQDPARVVRAVAPPGGHGGRRLAAVVQDAA